MKLTFLGTSCMVPTKERNHHSVFLEHENLGLLIDCGEGTQRQLKIAGIKPTKITHILISHWHGDHILGLPGLLQTLNTSEYNNELKIYGPIGTKDKINSIFSTFDFKVDFEISVNVLKDEKIDLNSLIVQSKLLDHTLPCLGYRVVEKDRRKIIESKIKKHNIPQGPLLGKLQDNLPITWKGKKIYPKDVTFVIKGKVFAFVLDTVVCKSAYVLAKEADILVCEAVYTSDLIEKAELYKHLTASQAAQIASMSGVKQLVLSHFSQRYKTTENLISEAKTIFKNTIAAYDFLKIG